MKGIWAIVLAAGESRRMGSPKMILPYEGMTIIEKVLENVLASDVEKVVTVLGSHSEEIMKVIERFQVPHCYNSNFKDGMLSSVKCGFEFLPREFRAAMVLLGDQPMVETSVINKLIKAYNETGKGILVPVFQNKRGHPLMVDKKYRDEIINLDDPEGLKGLLLRHPVDLLEVNAENSSVLDDIDTREDYNNQINKTSETWKRQSGSN
ncbi:MAG: nucleotidyltransferase family protein [Bacteroidales bacterium]